MSGYSQVKTSQVESTVDTELTIKPSHFVLLFEAYDDYQTVALSATITIFTELHPQHSRTHTAISFITRHVIFMRLPHIAKFLGYFGKSARIAYFFPRKLAFSTAVLTFFVFLLPISIRFCYLKHLVANRMAPFMCLDPCGTRWGSWFQAVLYHISIHFWCLCGLHVFLNATYN